MTRTKAWRKVAEAFDTPFDERTPEQRDWTADGLCWAMQHVLHVSVSNAYGPMGRLAAYLGVGGLFWWPCRGFSEMQLDPAWTPDCDAERATFAGLMAAMTQRERNQLVEGL